jgi:hypothetical protein
MKNRSLHFFLLLYVVLVPGLIQSSAYSAQQEGSRHSVKKHPEAVACNIDNEDQKVLASIFKSSSSHKRRETIEILATEVREEEDDNHRSDCFRKKYKSRGEFFIAVLFKQPIGSFFSVPVRRLSLARYAADKMAHLYLVFQVFRL